MFCKLLNNLKYLLLIIFLSNSSGAQEIFSDVVNEIDKKGKALVIVEFTTENKANSNFSNTQSSESFLNNKANIKIKQNELRKSLSEQGILIKKTYSNLPYFVTTIDKLGFEKLLLRNDIKSISLNKTFKQNQIVKKKIITKKVEKIKTDQLNNFSRPLLDETVSFINADKLWDQGFTGAGQVIVVLDDGIDTNHDMFKTNIIDEACFSDTFDETDESLCPNGLESQTGTGAASNCIPGTEVCEHGSHVAGIAAGNDTTGDVKRKGVAFEAQLLPIQVFTTFNNTEDCGGAESCQLSYTSSQLSALNYTLDRTQDLNIASVNMSLGGGLFESFCDENSRKWAIDELRKKGVVTAIAAGNEGEVGLISSPACISTSMTVSSVITTEPHQSVNHAEMVDVLAPGVQVVSAITNNAYAAFTGTSMATPHVAGAIALLKSAKQNASIDDIEIALKQTGINKTLENWSWETPLIDLDAALRSLGATKSITGRIISYLSPASDTTAKSLLRFHNRDSSQGVLTLKVMDDGNGSLIGAYEKNISAGTTVEISINEIERDLVLDELFQEKSGSTLSMFASSSFRGYAQHIRWDPSDGSFANLTTCDNGVSDNLDNMIAVHTSKLPRFPSYIVAHNTGESDNNPIFIAEDARNGEELGRFTLGDTIKPNTSRTIFVSDLLEFFDVQAESDQFYMNLKVTSAFTGFIQHIVDNQDAGLITNMTLKCDL